MSAHVDEITWKLLSNSSLPVEPELAAFHRTFWGVPGGRMVKTKTGRRVVCITNSDMKLFAGLERGPIVVRATYIELWEYLRRSYLATSVPDAPPATLIYGQPGIGKSVCLLFLMVAAAEAGVPFAYHHLEHDFAFVCLDKGQFFIRPSFLRKIRFTQRALILIENPNTEPPSSSFTGNTTAHVVTSSSPRTRRYQSFIKQKNADFYTLSLVPEHEFRDVLNTDVKFGGHELDEAVSVATYTQAPSIQDVSAQDDMIVDSGLGASTWYLDADGVKRWDHLVVYHLFGPSLRFPLRTFSWLKGDVSEITPKYNWGKIIQDCGDVIRVLVNPDSANAIHPADSEGSWGFHTLFFERPHASGPVTSFPPNNLYVPTPFLQKVVASGVRSLMQTKRIDMLAMVKNHGALHGIVFEVAALEHMATVSFEAKFSDASFPSLIVRPVDSGYIACPHKYRFPSSATPPFPKHELKECDLDASEPWIQNTTGVYPCRPGFPSADAVILADGVDGVRYEMIVQITVAKSHEISQKGVNIITAALNQHKPPRKHKRLFLFVSDDVEKSRRLAQTPLKDWTVGSVTLTQDELLELGRSS